VNGRIILDLCGGTGAWSRPYAEAGYDVRVITLPDYDVTKTTCHAYANPNDDGAMFFHKANEGFTYINPADVCGILAAPPCTEFSVAKGARPRDLSSAMEIVEACLRIIWHCRLHGRPRFWALENPRGLLRQFLGIPRYTFEQWQFGSNKRKATDLWGYFNRPVPTVRTMPELLNDGRARAHAADWMTEFCVNQAKFFCQYPPEYSDYINQFKGDAKRAAARAITPAGFAEAFWRANK
jgi:hypothetical protein